MPSQVVLDPLNLNYVQKRVLRFVASRRNGATCYETEVGLNMAHQSASPRQLELRNFGFLELVSVGGGQFERRPTNTDRYAYVYQVTEAGREYDRKYNTQL